MCEYLYISLCIYVYIYIYMYTYMRILDGHVPYLFSSREGLIHSSSLKGWRYTPHLLKKIEVASPHHQESGWAIHLLHEIGCCHI